MLKKFLTAIAHVFNKIDFYLRGLELLIECIFAVIIAGAFLAAGVFLVMKILTS